MNERNAEMCRRYTEGLTIEECITEYSLKRQRVKQILKRGGVWKPKPVEPSDRNAFLGVNVTEADKEKLRQEAARRGISASKLTSDMIKQMLAEQTEQYERPE